MLRRLILTYTYNGIPNVRSRIPHSIASNPKPTIAHIEYKKAPMAIMLPFTGVMMLRRERSFRMMMNDAAADAT